jgi:hypothetical protein
MTRRYSVGIAHSAEVALFFNIISGHLDALAASWHKFKSVVAVEI